MTTPKKPATLAAQPTRNTQAKFTAALSAEAARLGCELIADYNFSNCGTFRLQRPASLETLWERPFDFQPDSARFSHMGDKSRPYLSAKNSALAPVLVAMCAEMATAAAAGSFPVARRA
jgi:hypothetical protein